MLAGTVYCSLSNDALVAVAAYPHQSLSLLHQLTFGTIFEEKYALLTGQQLQSCSSCLSAFTPWQSGSLVLTLRLQAHSLTYAQQRCQMPNTQPEENQTYSTSTVDHTWHVHDRLADWRASWICAWQCLQSWWLALKQTSDAKARLALLQSRSDLRADVCCLHQLNLIVKGPTGWLLYFRSLTLRNRSWKQGQKLPELTSWRQSLS